MGDALAASVSNLDHLDQVTRDFLCKKVTKNKSVTQMKVTVTFKLLVSRTFIVMNADSKFKLSNKQKFGIKNQN
jgi:hypothetical protein